MKRFRQIMLQVSVVVAVAISLVLSWLIWTNNARYQQQGTQSSDVQPVSHRTLSAPKSMNEIFSPTTLVHTTHGQQNLVYSYKYDTINDIFYRFRRAKVSRLKTVSIGNGPKYQKMLHANNTLQMIYPTPITIDTLSQVIKQKNLNLSKDHYFNRIVIADSKKHSKHEVYFLNDSNNAIYKAQGSGLDYDRIDKSIKNNDTIPVDLQILQNNRVMLFYQKPLHMKVFSYLISSQENNSYISNLLNSSQGSNITVRDSGDEKIYHNGIYRMLIFNQKNDQVTYKDYSKTTVPHKPADALNNAYQDVSQIGNPLTGLRLFYYNGKKNDIVFRNYVEGFPIFRDNTQAVTKISYSKKGETMEFSKRSLQVPVPNENKNVELPATNDLVEQLKAAGYKANDIQNITVGYEWIDDNQDNKDIVDLKPTYLVKLNGHWKSYDELIH